MEDKTGGQKARTDSSELIVDLNFVPQWARKPPGENHYTQKEYVDERPARRDDRRGGRPDHGRRTERPRRPRKDHRQDDVREERAASRPRPKAEPIKELPVKVSFLPEQKRLASLVRQIHHTRRAFPLMDLANLLIHDAEGYLVKVEVNKSAPEFELFQCKKCKAIATTPDAIKQHIQATHLLDYYSRKEIETEPPAGNFPGVARCRKSGILLGPPNHHSYTAKVNEVHQSRYAHLSLEEYKRTIEMVKDEAVVDQWKEESRKQVVYQLKKDEDGVFLDLRRAELEFAKTVAGLFEPTQRAVVPAKVAQALTDRDITHAIHGMWTKESRFPLSMSFAMRAAFRHMHLYLFKAGKINFVTHIKPNPVKPEKTVDQIADVLVFLKEHAGSSRLDLLKALHSELDPASQEAKDALKPLGWLVERGHIIEFFNGTLSLPLGDGKKRK